MRDWRVIKGQVLLFYCLLGPFHPLKLKGHYVQDVCCFLHDLHLSCALTLKSIVTELEIFS